jgi:hypothetical protein
MIRQVLATAASHAEERAPRIVLVNRELAAQLEQRLLDRDFPVVRTRVQDHGVWLALHEAGVVTLVEIEEPAQVVSREYVSEPVTDSSVDALLVALGISSTKERA